MRKTVFACDFCQREIPVGTGVRLIEIGVDFCAECGASKTAGELGSLITRAMQGRQVVAQDIALRQGMVGLGTGGRQF